MRCEPANSLVTKLGGLRAVSNMADVSIHTVTKWRLPRDRGGTGGIIPHWHHQKLLSAAREADIAISPVDFFPASEAAA